MKYFFAKQLPLAIVLLLSIHTYAQNDCWDDIYNGFYDINFDDGTCMEGLFIDTLSNPNNIWQIGGPQKNTFTSAYSAPNVIVTDTVNTYPINDTSSFIIKDLAGYGFPSYFAIFGGFYHVNSDSLNDFGRIELSPDNGNTWYDILNNAALTNYWEDNGSLYAIPILTGNSNGWKYFQFNTERANNELGLGINPGDTIKYRFTFISDSIADSLDGLMFDSFEIVDFGASVNEYNINKISSIAYPNPAMDKVTIEFNNPNQSPYELKVVNNLGEEVLKRFGIHENEVLLDLSKVEAGFYTYYLQSLTRESWSTGTIIKTR